MNTQSKVMAVIKAMVEANGLELIDNRQWANTGTLRIEPRDSLTAIATLSYSFQDTYSSFQFTPDNFIHGLASDGHLHAVKHDELEVRLIAPLRKTLNTIGARVAQ